MDYRVQVYLRRRGQTIAEGRELKSELFNDREELIAAIAEYAANTLAELDEGNEEAEEDGPTAN